MTISLDHIIWIHLEIGNNSQATCHKVSLNVLVCKIPSCFSYWFGSRHIYYIFDLYLISPEPIGGEITIAWESSWMDKAPQTDMERRLMDQLKDGKFAKNAPVQSERRGCYYTTIPASIKHSNIFGDELTALNLDKVIFWASC